MEGRCRWLVSTLSSSRRFSRFSLARTGEGISFPWRRTSGRVRRGRETRESPPNRGTLDQRLHPEGYHIFRETILPSRFSYSYFSVSSLFSLGKLGRFLPSIFLRRGCWSFLMLGLITRGWLVYGCRLFRPGANSYGRGWDFEGWKTAGNYSFGNGGRWKLFNSSLKYRFRFFVEREHRSFQLYLYSFVIFFNLIFFFFLLFHSYHTMTNENKFRFVHHNDKRTRSYFFSNFEKSERKYQIYILILN